MKHLKILTAKDIAYQLEISQSLAEKSLTNLKKHYEVERITQLHLHDWLGVTALSVYAEFMHPNNEKLFPVSQ